MQKLFALVLVIALITTAAMQSSSKREDRLKAIQEKLADMSWSEYDPESFVAIQKAQAKIGARECGQFKFKRFETSILVRCEPLNARPAHYMVRHYTHSDPSGDQASAWRTDAAGEW